MAHNLSLEKRQELARIFVELDTDGNGVLSREEVGVWLRDSSGYFTTEKEREIVFRWMDANVDGRITLDEFMEAICKLHKASTARPASQSSQSHSQTSAGAATSASSSSKASSRSSGRSGIDSLLDLFNTMDTNGDGQLSEDELLQGLKDAGYNVTRGQIQKLISNLDRDGNGHISYSEFIKAFKS